MGAPHFAPGHLLQPAHDVVEIEGLRLLARRKADSQSVSQPHPRGRMLRGNIAFEIVPSGDAAIAVRNRVNKKAPADRAEALARFFIHFSARKCVTY